MRTPIRSLPGWRSLGAACLLALLSTASAWGQQQPAAYPQPTSQADPMSPADPAEQSSSKDENTSQPPQTTPAGDWTNPGNPSDTLPIRQAGKASLLPDLLTSPAAMRLGPVFLRSLEISYASLTGDSPSGAVERTDRILMGGNLTYEHRFNRYRLALQYLPRLSLVNGSLENNFSNQSVSLDGAYALSPRTELTIKDAFSYVGTHSLIGDSLDADWVTGSTIQNQVVDASSNYLSNTTSVGVDHGFSARDRMGVSGSFGYLSSTSSDAFSNWQYGATVRYTHRGTNREVGAFYGLTLVQDTQGRGSNAYHNFGIAYAQRLGRTWQVGGSVGALGAGYSAGDRAWTIGGTVAVMKNFRNSTVALAYERGQAVAGYLTGTTVGDRVDLSYQASPLRKLSTSFSLGYARATSPTLEGVTSRYGRTDISYRLFNQVSWFVNYVYKSQAGVGDAFATGTRHLYMTGLRWEFGNITR